MYSRRLPCALPIVRQLVLQSGVHLKIQDADSPLVSNASLLLIGNAVRISPPSSTFSLPVMLLSPAIIPDEQAGEWIKLCPKLSVLLPGINEDGRSRFWQDCTDANKLNPKSVKILEGVGLRVDWAWPSVVTHIKSLNYQ